MSSLLKVPVVVSSDPVERSSLAPGPRLSIASFAPPGTVTVMTWERVAMFQMSATSEATAGEVRTNLLSMDKVSPSSAVGQRESAGVT
jgi:hypothetical protein